jgi:hypothetical protein
MPKKFEVFNGYLVTHNSRERTYTIYNRQGEFLSTVNDGELYSEIEKIENEED